MSSTITATCQTSTITEALYEWITIWRNTKSSLFLQAFVLALKRSKPCWPYEPIWLDSSICMSDFCPYMTAEWACWEFWLYALKGQHMCGLLHCQQCKLALPSLYDEPLAKKWFKIKTKFFSWVCSYTHKWL